MMLLCAAVSAADFKEGNTAYVVKYSLPVTEKPTAGGSGSVQIKSGADGGESVAEAKNGASLDVIQKDFGSGYSKIWFNSKECYIKTESLTDFQSTP